MILFNLCGAPGSGKTTSALELTLAFKKAHYNVELVGETSRDHMKDGSFAPLQDNQFFINGKQYERLYRLFRTGVEIAVADSPLVQGLLYSEHLPYYTELASLMQKTRELCTEYNVLIHRAFPYRESERLQTKETADSYIPKIQALVGSFWLEVRGNDEGNHLLVQKALEVARHHSVSGTLRHDGTLKNSPLFG